MSVRRVLVRKNSSSKLAAVLLVIFFTLEVLLVPISIQVPENLLEEAARKAVFEPPSSVKNWLNSQLKQKKIWSEWCDHILVWFTGFPEVKATVEIVMKHRKSGYRQVWYVVYVKPKWIVWKKKTKTKYIIYKKKKIITGYHYTIHCWKKPVWKIYRKIVKYYIYRWVEDDYYIGWWWLSEGGHWELYKVTTDKSIADYYRGREGYRVETVGEDWQFYDKTDSSHIAEWYRFHGYLVKCEYEEVCMPLREPEYDYLWVKFKETFDWREAYGYQKSSEYKVETTTIYINEKDHVVKVTYNPADLLPYRNKEAYIIEEKTEVVEAAPGKYFFSKKDAEDFAEQLHRTTSIPTEVKSKWKWCTWTETKKHYYSFTVLKITGNTITFYNPDNTSRKYVVVVKQAHVNNVPMDPVAGKSRIFSVAVPARGKFSVKVLAFVKNPAYVKVVVSISTWREVACISLSASSLVLKYSEIQDTIGPVNWRVFFQQLGVNLATLGAFTVFYEISPPACLIVASVAAAQSAAEVYSAYTDQIKLLERLGATGLAAGLSLERNALILESATGIPSWSIMKLLDKDSTPEEKAVALANIFTFLPIAFVAIKDGAKKIVEKVADEEKFSDQRFLNKFIDYVAEKLQLTSISGTEIVARLKKMIKAVKEYGLFKLKSIDVEVYAAKGPGTGTGGEDGFKVLLKGTGDELRYNIFKNKLYYVVGSFPREVKKLISFKGKNLILIIYEKAGKLKQAIRWLSESSKKWRRVKGHIFVDDSTLKPINQYVVSLGPHKITVKLNEFSVDNALNLVYSIEILFDEYKMNWIAIEDDHGHIAVIQAARGKTVFSKKIGRWAIEIGGLRIYEGTNTVRLRIGGRTYTPVAVTPVKVKGAKIFIVRCEETPGQFTRVKYVTFSPFKDITYVKIIHNFEVAFKKVKERVLVNAIRKKWGEQPKDSEVIKCVLNIDKSLLEKEWKNVVGAVAELIEGTLRGVKVHEVNPGHWVKKIGDNKYEITINEYLLSKVSGGVRGPDIVTTIGKYKEVIEVKGVSSKSWAMARIDEAERRLPNFIFCNNEFHNKITFVLYKVQKTDYEEGDKVMLLLRKIVEYTFTFNEKTGTWG